MIKELEKMQSMKATVAPVVLGALSAMISKLGEWLQQIPGMTSEIFVQKSTVLGTPKILCRINTAYFYVAVVKLVTIGLCDNVALQCPGYC